MLVQSVDIKTAWESTTVVVWNGFMPYTAISNISENDFVTVESSE